MYSMDDNLAIPPVHSCSYPLRAGNLVRPLVDGVPAFRRICEAIESAQSAVWITITFMWTNFTMPDDQGTLLDVLDRAAARGVDVRVIFWRPDTATENLKRNAFWGSADHMLQLETRRSGVRIRWDQAHPGFCQHQKSWLIDANGECGIAFVGGINLNPHSMVTPAHRGQDQNHDAYVEIAGPSTVDIQHNFVQRWNEASERHKEDGRWGIESETQLSFPSHIPTERGKVGVQIQRTVHQGRYTNGEPAVGGTAFNITAGEQSIYNQYRAAIEAAQNSIYIENQYITVREIVSCLHQAVQRGVEVVALVPAKPVELASYMTQEQRACVETWAALEAYENFTLAGMAGLDADGQRCPIYVHSKLMLIDDAWATVGSCNLHHFSLFGNGEMNASFWCPDTVRAFRCALFQEHLGQDTSHWNDLTALRYFRQVALENRGRFDADRHEWQGLVFALSGYTG